MSDASNLRQFMKLADVVCTYFGVSLEEIKDSSRVMEKVYPRWALLILISENMNVPVSMIGGWLNRTKSTVSDSTFWARSNEEREDDFRHDMRLLREFVLHPEKTFRRVKGKNFRNTTADKEIKFERPKAVYGNRNIHDIHDHYASIRL